jgi:hypothetical protein
MFGKSKLNFRLHNGHVAITGTRISYDFHCYLTSETVLRYENRYLAQFFSHLRDFHDYFWILDIDAEPVTARDEL